MTDPALEFHTRADMEGVGLAVCRDIPRVLAQLRNEFIGRSAIVEYQGLVDVLDDLAAGGIIGQGRIQVVSVSPMEACVKVVGFGAPAALEMRG